jgi:hypothetical protein
MTDPFLPDHEARCPGVTIAPVIGGYQPQGPGTLMVECRDCLRRTAPANDPTRVVMQPPMPTLMATLMANITSTDMPTPLCDFRIAP